MRSTNDPMGDTWRKVDLPSPGAAVNRMVLNRTTDWKEYAFTALLIVGTVLLDWLISADFVYYGVMLGQLALAATWLAMGNWPLPARIAGVSLYVAATLASTYFAQEEPKLAEWPASTAALVAYVAVAAVPLGVCRFYSFRLLRVQDDASCQDMGKTDGSAEAASTDNSAQTESIVENRTVKSQATQFTLRRLFSWITTAGMAAALLRLIIEDNGPEKNGLVDSFVLIAILCLLLGLILFTVAWGAFNQNEDAANWLWLLGFGILMAIPFFFVLIPTFGMVLLIFYIYRSFGYRWVQIVDGKIREAEHATA